MEKNLLVFTWSQVRAYGMTRLSRYFRPSTNKRPPWRLSLEEQICQSTVLSFADLITSSFSRSCKWTFSRWHLGWSIPPDRNRYWIDLLPSTVAECRVYLNEHEIDHWEEINRHKPARIASSVHPLSSTYLRASRKILSRISLSRWMGISLTELFKGRKSGEFNWHLVKLACYGRLT